MDVGTDPSEQATVIRSEFPFDGCSQPACVYGAEPGRLSLDRYSPTDKIPSYGAVPAGAENEDLGLVQHHLER